jgi:MFS family permease
MLGMVYNNGKTSLGTNEDLGVKVATPIGNLVGQLLFGWLADVVGRKKMCMFRLPPITAYILNAVPFQMASS